MTSGSGWASRIDIVGRRGVPRVLGSAEGGYHERYVQQKGGTTSVTYGRRGVPRQKYVPRTFTDPIVTDVCDIGLGKGRSPSVTVGGILTFG